MRLAAIKLTPNYLMRRNMMGPFRTLSEEEWRQMDVQYSKMPQKPIMS
jgi:hypothetical protein